jgi:hypothetical protein
MERDSRHYSSIMGASLHGWGEFATPGMIPSHGQQRFRKNPGPGSQISRREAGKFAVGTTGEGRLRHFRITARKTWEVICFVH